jgi:hypothetical protein
LLQPRKKGNRGLRRLFCSINYDVNNGSVSRCRVKEKAASLYATFIALIMKKFGAIDLKNFQPISLASGVHNIIAKVLANKLRRIMEKLILKPHIDFVKGMQFLDSFLMANERLDGKIRSGEPGVLCKLILKGL